MDRRRFFTRQTLTESVLSDNQKRSLFEDTMAELNRLYEEDEQKQEAEATKAAEPETPEANADAGTASEPEEILDELKDSNYVEFVKILNSDGKSKAFIDYLSKHYQLGDDTIQTVKKAGPKEGTIACSKLQPTQENISLSKSLGMINKPDWAVKIINTPTAAFDTPTVTYAGKYIIDGHHRWSKAYALNGGDCVIKVLNFPAIDGVSWEDMLKAVQLAIVAAVPGASLENPVKDDNMLASSDDVIKKFVIENICDGVLAAMKEKGRGDTKEAVADTVAKNVAQMRDTSSPVAGAKPRAYMPQMDDDGKAKELLDKAVIDLT